MNRFARIKPTTKAKLKYMHYNMTEEVKTGKSTTIEEQVIHGEDGISFKYFEKVDDKMEKHSAKENKDGTYTYKVMKDGKADTMTLSKDELLKKMKGNKKLDFAVKYISTNKQKGGAKKRKTTKRKSKKTTKKKSKKNYKKTK
jgi:hypothetical protein